MDKVFPEIICDCLPDGAYVCGNEEHILRMICHDKWAKIMTPAQRQWCIGEAVCVGEGTWKEDDLLDLSDKDLAQVVLRAWADYARSNCGF